MDENSQKWVGKMDEIMYDVENDFLWLKDTGVAIPVYNISEPKLPMVIIARTAICSNYFSRM